MLVASPTKSAHHFTEASLGFRKCIIQAIIGHLLFGCSKTATSSVSMWQRPQLNTL